MSDIGIVMVTYNSEAEVGASLDAAVRTGADVVVVDNASHDGTVAEIRKRGGVRAIVNGTNLGFAAAVNQGIAVLNSRYVVLLNPDAVIQSGLDPLRAACDLPGAAAAGGRLVDAAGASQTGFMVRRLPTPASLILEVLLLNRVWPNNPVNRRYRALDVDYSTLCEVEQPAGAFLMVRRSVWSEMNGLDERFAPLWFEDVDLCRRMVDRGYRVYFEPKAVAKHTGAHSIAQLSLEKRQFYWYRSLLRYSAKHFSPGSFRALCLAVVTGSLVRATAESARRWSLKPMAEYGKVVRLASRCLWCGWGDGVVGSDPEI